MKIEWIRGDWLASGWVDMIGHTGKRTRPARHTAVRKLLDGDVFRFHNGLGRASTCAKIEPAGCGVHNPDKVELAQSD
jgi:hypothetical protein